MKKLHMKHIHAAWLLAMPVLAAAQGLTPPGSGTLLQQVQPVTPALPVTREPSLVMEQSGKTALPPSQPFWVETLLITGNTQIPAPALRALVAEAEGKTLTLAQLGELADRITEHYRNQGYPLSRAIIPAQAIDAGVVRIEIIEARYGQISLQNKSAVKDSFLQDILASLQSGQSISQAPLDQAMLKLSDVPGVLVRGSLEPGQAVGTSDLLIDATALAAVGGQVVADGYGNRYTGRERLGLALSLSNPLNHGDVASLNALSSGSGMNYARIGYETLLNSQGLRAGGAYSDLHYVLGGPVTSADGRGNAQVSSAWLKLPLLRSRQVNVQGQAQYEQMNLRDRLATTATDRHLNSAVLSLSGDWQDALLAGSMSSWSVGWAAGKLAFDNDAAQQADAGAAKTEGHFTKWTASVSRLQGLSPKTALYVTASGQWSRHNLDASQKMSAGGPSMVRAYDAGAVSGDRGYFFGAELRRSLDIEGAGQWTALAFIDSAHLTVNAKPWLTSANSARLSGAGLGLLWTGPQRWSSKLYIATPIGAKPEQVGVAKSSRAWVELARAF